MGVGASTPAGPTIRVISYSWVNGAWGSYHFGEYLETDTVNDVALGSGADTIVVLTGNEELTAYVRGPDDQSPFVPLDDNLATGIATLVSNLTGGAYPTLYLRFGSLDDCANGCTPGETAVDSYVNNGNGTYTINFEDGTSAIIANNVTTGLWEQTGPAVNINPAVPAVDTLVVGAQSTEGPGTRMFYADGSFRAGEVDGTQWNAGNRGDNSAAFGLNCIASGARSFASGLYCTASGAQSLALGYAANAPHDNSFVWSDGTALVSSTAEKQATFAASNGFRVLGAASATGTVQTATIHAVTMAVTGDGADIELALAAKGASDVTVNKDPVTSMGVATKQYVDSAIAGLDWKESCQFATMSQIATGNHVVPNTISNVDLTSDTFDLSGPKMDIGVGDRVLVKNETDPTVNGIYVCTVDGNTGTLMRAPDHDGSPASEVSQGNTTYVENGNTAGFMSYVLAGDGTGPDGQIVLNVDPINWYRFSPQSPGKSSLIESTVITTQWDGSTVTLDIKYTRVFDQVFMNVPAHYSSNTNIAPGGATFTIPEGYRPANNEQLVFAVVDSNATAPGRITINSVGGVLMGPMASLLYSGIPNNGWRAISVSYLGAAL
jgi:hypothetical protein